MSDTKNDLPPDFKTMKQVRKECSAIAAAHLSSITVHASNAMRGVFFLNVMMGIAAFLNKDQTSFRYALLGAAATVVGAIFAYLAQRFYMSSDLYSYTSDVLSIWKKEMPKRKLYEKHLSAFVMTVMACIFVAASLIMFFCALWSVL